jgi:hypothetical protein
MLKSGRGLAASLITFVIIISLSSSALAGEQLLLDEILTISNWYVHASQNSFAAEEDQEARIKITKNTSDKEIRRGVFVLNGAYTFLRDFLIGDELVFEKNVSLNADNSLIVVLLGQPGAQISFQVIADDGPEPSPEISAFTAEPLSLKRGESATLT